MKKSLLAVLGMMLLAGAATAGPRVGLYVNFGGGGYGCAPRYYAPPVCYAPRVAYGRPPVVYYQSAPSYCYTPARVVYAPVCPALIVNTVSFGWRR